MHLSERVNAAGTNLRSLASWFMVMTGFEAIVAGSGGLIFWDPLPYYGSPSTWLVIGGCIAAITAVIVTSIFVYKPKEIKTVTLIPDAAFAGTYVVVLLNPQVEIMVLVGMAGLAIGIVSNVVSFFSRIKQVPCTGTGDAMHAVIGIVLGSFTSLLFKSGERWGSNIVAWSMPAILLACSLVMLASNPAGTATGAADGQGEGPRPPMAATGAGDGAGSGSTPGKNQPVGLIGFALGFLAVAFVKLLDLAFLAPLPHALATTMIPACLVLGVVSTIMVYLVSVSPRAAPGGAVQVWRVRWRVLLYASGAVLPIACFACFFAIPLGVLVTCVVVAPALLAEPVLMGYAMSFIPYTIVLLVQLGNALQSAIRHEVTVLASRHARSMQPASVPALVGSCVGATIAIGFIVIGLDYRSEDVLAFLAVLVPALLGIATMNAPRFTAARRRGGLRPPQNPVPAAVAGPARGQASAARAPDATRAVQVATVLYLSLAFIVPMVMPHATLPGSPLDEEKHVLAFYYAWYANSTDHTNASMGIHDIKNENFSQWHWDQNGHQPWQFDWSEITFSPPATEAEINESACTWNRTWMDISHLPLKGPYDSADPDVIKDHLLTCADVGIDTLIVSWNGEYDDRDVNAFNNLLTMATLLEAQGHQQVPNLTIYFEHATDWDERAADDYGCEFQDPGFFPLDPPPCSQERLIARNLIYYVDTWGAHPKVFKVDGRPVIFVWAPITRGTTIDRWRTIRGIVERAVGPVYLHGNTYLEPGGKYAVLDPLWPQVFDGHHCYILGSRFVNAESNEPAPAFSLREIYAESVRVAKRAGTNFAATAYPGYDDRNRHLFDEDGGGSYVNRRGTKNYGADWTYARLWEDIIASGARWAVIATFNEWHEGTEIEASFEYGDFFLDLTRQYTTAFKNA